MIKIDITMGIREAQKYITQHRRMQADPMNWPDFMTGLPDRAAVQQEIEKIYPKLRTHCISYICIENIQPYLVKYGSKNHVDIIQWAAAILKTTADKHDAFVGILDTHDFVVICRKSVFDAFIKAASASFQKKASEFYSKDDLRKGYVLSFSRDGKDILMGLMELKYRTTNDLDLPRERILPELERSCCTCSIPA